MKRLLHICLLATCLFLTGCRGRMEPDAPISKEKRGDLVITVGSSALETKSANEAEGLAFGDVLVIIADDAGNIIDKVYKSYPYTPSSPADIQTPVTLSELSEDEIQFHNLKVGAYQVYAYANICHTDWQIEGATVEDVEKALTVGGEDKLNADRLLKTLGAGETPSAPGASGSMLLTGHKELSVGVSANIGEIDLIRPVVRFNVYVHNHTPYQITLNELSFSNFNASTTYLLDHRTDDGRPTVPDAASYGSLPAYNTASPIRIDAPTAEDDEDGKALVYSTLLYENQAVDDYRMFAKVSLTDEFSNTISKELTTNGVRLITYKEIAAMQSGDSKTVMIVNPTSNGGDYFGWSGNSMLYSSAAFTIMDSYKSKAEEILNSSQISGYYQFTLSRGEDGRYHLYRGPSDMFNNVSGNKESGLFLEEGFIPTYTDYMIAPGFAGHLSRFKDSANRYLFNNSNKLNAQTNSADRGNRMWAFYEAYPKGSILKFIDNETAQVRPLSYMTRNQELNVVMNVYYEELSRQFDFVVDNAYWTDGGAHKPSHQFN